MKLLVGALVLISSVSFAGSKFSYLANTALTPELQKAVAQELDQRCKLVSSKEISTAYVNGGFTVVFSSTWGTNSVPTLIQVVGTKSGKILSVTSDTAVCKVK